MINKFQLRITFSNFVKGFLNKTNRILIPQKLRNSGQFQSQPIPSNDYQSDPILVFFRIRLLINHGNMPRATQRALMGPIQTDWVCVCTMFGFGRYFAWYLSDVHHSHSLNYRRDHSERRREYVHSSDDVWNHKRMKTVMTMISMTTKKQKHGRHDTNTRWTQQQCPWQWQWTWE